MNVDDSLFLMDNSIMFSVVTPVLNGREFASRYVQCLKSQVFTNWEACVVDDGSVDGTYTFLEELTSSDKRFRLFSNPLKKELDGPYQARNYALSCSRGRYICFLDIDDLWHPTRLSSLFDLISKEYREEKAIIQWVHHL